MIEISLFQNGAKAVHMNVFPNIVNGSVTIIPKGCVLVVADDGTPVALTHDGDLVPQHVKLDLYQKLRAATNNLGLGEEGIV